MKWHSKSSVNASCSKKISQRRLDYVTSHLCFLVRGETESQKGAGDHAAGAFPPSAWAEVF
jgi:hypothetical protein